MNHKILVLGFLLIASFSLFAANVLINPDQYLVKPNDVFLLQSISVDTLSVRSIVLPTGSINLYPFADTVYIAGKTLTEANLLIEKRLNKTLKRNNVSFSLYKMAPFNYSIIGAVANPGDYTSTTPVSLFESIKVAGGMVSSSSSKIAIVNNGKGKYYDINKFLGEGDLEHNPLINGGDVIKIEYAKENLKVYTNNDTLNFVQSFELSESKPVKEIVTSLFNKHTLSSFEKFTVINNGQVKSVDRDFMVSNGDKLFIPIEEVYVYVTGNVSKPGKVAYNGADDPQYYIAKAGGPLPTGSRKTIYVITKEGERYKYTKGRKINQGDILYVPESFRSMFTAYLIPVSTIISLVSTVIVINNNTKKNN
jgi:protein involved in polysaccharide export with SLBB domain